MRQTRIGEYTDKLRRVTKGFSRDTWVKVTLTKPDQKEEEE